MPDLTKLFGLFGEIIDVLHSRGMIDAAKRDDLKTRAGEATDSPAHAVPSDATVPGHTAFPDSTVSTDPTVTGPAFRKPVFDEPAKP